MTIRQMFEPILDKLEADFSARESDLASKEATLTKQQDRFANSLAELTKKEQSLIEWEATVRTRENKLATLQEALDAQTSSFSQTKSQFDQYRATELTALENRQRKLTADETTVKLTKEQLDNDRKQQEIIKSKLVSERAALDGAWNQFKYEKLRT